MGFRSISSVGLGLRKDFCNTLLQMPANPVDFLEIVPENWMNMGNKRARKLEAFSKRYPIVAHGLSLSIGSTAPIDDAFLEALVDFFKTYSINCYSEHLSYCSDEQGFLYDLLPIPFTSEAVDYVSERIKHVQSRLGQKVAFENSSYYYAPGQQISELDFIIELTNKSDCLLLLDINNVYVNSVNHSYDPKHFIQSIPTDRIAYLHIAGHKQERSGLIFDTHASSVSDPVWELLDFCYDCHGVIPTVLERDSNIPPLSELLQETEQIKTCQTNKER